MCCSVSAILISLVLIGLLGQSSGTVTRPDVTYYPSLYDTDWTSAQADCQHIGGSLAKVTSSAEQDELVDNFMNIWKVEYMWLGGTDVTSEGSWLWEDETSVDLSLPAAAPNSGSINPDYLRISKDGDWEAEDGQQTYSFFCEVKLDSVEAKAAQWIRKCWLANGLFNPAPGTESRWCPYHYFVPRAFTKPSKNWLDAKTECEDFEGELPMITSLEETMMFIRLRSIYELADTVWLGANDEDADGNYTESDGGAISWGSEHAGAKPMTSGKCMFMDCTINEWIPSDCTVTRKVMCRRHMSKARHYGDACFWFGPNERDYNAKPACENKGARLAKVTNPEEMMMLLQISSTGWLDGSTKDGNPWGDGTPMTWSEWRTDVGTYSALVINSDFDRMFWTKNHGTYFTAYCDKPVKTTKKIPNSMKTVEPNKVKYTCYAGYEFEDGSIEKIFTCQTDGNFDDFVNGFSGCSLAGNAYLLESGFGFTFSKDIAHLFDADNATCVNLVKYWTLTPVTTVRIPCNAYPNVTIISNNTGLDTLRKVLTVKVSNSVSNGTERPLLEHYKACNIQTEGSDIMTYQCLCEVSCSLFVQFKDRKYQSEMAATQVNVCGVNVA